MVHAFCGLTHAEKITPPGLPSTCVHRRWIAHQELAEDELLFALEQKEGGEREGGDARRARPTRPVPVHRMQVPPEAVGDLLAVWDFVKVASPQVVFSLS